eukprot:1275754-Rhodomonas_salina.1
MLDAARGWRRRCCAVHRGAQRVRAGSRGWRVSRSKHPHDNSHPQSADTGVTGGRGDGMLGQVVMEFEGNTAERDGALTAAQLLIRSMLTAVENAHPGYLLLSVFLVAWDVSVWERGDVCCCCCVSWEMAVLTLAAVPLCLLTLACLHLFLCPRPCPCPCLFMCPRPCLGLGLGL